MSRKSTGTVRPIGGRWCAKWSLPTPPSVDGTKPKPKRSLWTPLNVAPDAPRSVAEAEAARLAPLVRAAAERGVSGPIRETVEAYAGRWLDDREGRVASVEDDRARMRKHVLPTLGALDARTFTRDDVERLRDELDEKITDGELAWKTVASVWTLITSMSGDMVSAKKREFRIRTENPCRDVKPPERGSRKAKQYLYPSEFLQFVSCEAVPLRLRRAVTVAVYTFVRDGELRALRWDRGDLDLEHGTISVTRSLARSGTVKSTKSGETRRFAVEATLLPLLETMHDEADGKGPLVSFRDRHMARSLRAWLLRAGVTRHELHNGDAHRKPLTWHDLRATGLTWLAIRGDSAFKIKHRAGHDSMSTTELCIREAEATSDGFGCPFPTLPERLLGDRVECDARR